MLYDIISYDTMRARAFQIDVRLPLATPKEDGAALADRHPLTLLHGDGLSCSKMRRPSDSPFLRVASLRGFSGLWPHARQEKVKQEGTAVSQQKRKKRGRFPENHLGTEA